MLETIPKTYDHTDELEVYRFWEERGYFTPVVDPARQPFTIIMPPPNVTGELHIGHALTMIIEDVMIRWHRMLGEPTLWLPGTDHAGIATQVVVERELAEEGLTRHDLGRERFIERVWQSVDRYRNRITFQLRRFGSSCDWTRERFTLDPGPSRAVRTTFVRLYHDGLIYRGDRIINWCPRCATALSDLEVEHEETDGYLYYLKYPLEDGSGHIVVATTRPETMLGDTAVAVHPEDDRYRHLVGQRARLPVIGRLLPIIADEAVDPAFGTGAVKVTPAHDPVDFELAQRHGLERVLIMNLDATINENGGPYAGLDRYEARRRLVEDLKAQGLVEKVEPYRYSIGHCERCDTVVEPIISRQWFVRMKPLAEPALQVVLEGQIRIIPDRFVRVYANWLENIRDWCISRQIWWGHRIPVWYCQDCGETVVPPRDDPMRDPDRCPRCGSGRLEQDPDVLDTWFSSGLWPHSTLGWPDDTEDLRYFYPTSVMETGYDILFFWVARMVMLGLRNTGKIPFRVVYLHGLVRDAQGRKMSKSVGNVIDPLEIIDKYGADALRYALTVGITPGNDVRLGMAKVEAGRNFTNKLWNAGRFALGAGAGRAGLGLPAELTEADRWILSRLNRVTADVRRLMADYELGEALRLLYDFLWDEFCDWYIEIAKIQGRRARELGRPDTSPAVLYAVFEQSLRLLHPFMPFVTEKLWQHLTRERRAAGEPLPESVMLAPYPEPDESRFDPAAERDLEVLMDLIRRVRNVRADFRVPAGAWVEVVVTSDGHLRLLQEYAPVVGQLARALPVRVEPALPERPDGAVRIVGLGATGYVLVGAHIDLEAERRRLRNELAEVEADIARLRGHLDDPEFRAKAPAEVVEREEERLRRQEERLRRLREALES